MNKFKGLMTAFLIAAMAWVIPEFHHGLRVIGAPVFAIFLGMILSLIIKDKKSLQPGLSFASKKILQMAIVALGFSLNLSSIQQVGLQSLPIIVATITAALLCAGLVSRVLKIPKNIAILIGVGSSICGGSAIAATAPVIEAKDDEVAQAISVIFVFNVIAALIFPWIGQLLNLSSQGFALFAGTAINDTSSVSAAASTWDTLHQTGGVVLAHATIVKLVRTLAIIPITLALSLLKKETTSSNKRKLYKVFPTFILYFLLASLTSTLVLSLAQGEGLLLYKSWISLSTLASKFMIVVAMVAIGLNTDIRMLIKKGKKPILLGLICWLIIILVSLSLQSYFNLLY